MKGPEDRMTDVKTMGWRDSLGFRAVFAFVFATLVSVFASTAQAQHTSATLNAAVSDSSRVAKSEKNAPQSTIETGKYRLHKLELPIGEESYSIVRDGDSIVVHSNFEFT